MSATSRSKQREEEKGPTRCSLSFSYYSERILMKNVVLMIKKQEKINTLSVEQILSHKYVLILDEKKSGKYTWQNSFHAKLWGKFSTSKSFLFIFFQTRTFQKSRDSRSVSQDDKMENQGNSVCNQCKGLADEFVTPSIADMAKDRNRNREILLHVSPAEILKTWPGVTGGTSLHSCELLHIQNLDNNHQYGESTTWLCLSHLWFQNSSHWWIWWPDHIRCCAALEWAAITGAKIQD